MEPEHPGRIVAVHPHSDLYGSDRVFLESATTLAPDVLVVLSQRGPLAGALESRDVPLVIKPFPVLRKVELRSPRTTLVFLVRLLRSVVTLTLWLRAQQTSVLYVSTIAAPQWLIAGRLSGARVVCHVHESEPGMPRPVSALLLAPLVAAHSVIANSRDCLAWIRSSVGERVAHRSRVVYGGVDEPPSTVVASAIRRTGRRNLVVVGRLSARKGQDIAIAAAALVRRRGFDVTLSLVGDEYAGYEAFVEELRASADAELPGDVVFAGFQDPTPYVAEADVVLVPSRVEPFGLVAVEGLLLGRPVVAAGVGGLSEIIRDGETGLLVPPGDPEALADAIVRLLSDPARATALGEAGRSDARARFSMPAFRANLAETVLPCG